MRDFFEFLSEMVVIAVVAPIMIAVVGGVFCLTSYLIYKLTSLFL